MATNPKYDAHERFASGNVPPDWVASTVPICRTADSQFSGRLPSNVEML
jgi:hypothetical protein